MTFVTKNSLRAATSLVVAATICLAPRRAHALRNYDGEITPAVILAGTAIIDSDDTTAAIGYLENEAWVVMRKYGIELGIRGRLCYEDTNGNANYCPDNVYPTNKDGTFNFEAGAIPDDDHFCPIYYGPINNDGGPEWCIDYSINVDYKEDDDDEEEAQYRGRGRELWFMEEEEEPRVLADYVYQLSLDADPSCATNSSTWDPINAARDGDSCLEAFYMGDNDTPSGEGIEVLCNDTDTYESNITESSVAQQTLNYVLLTDPFFPGGYPVISPDPVRETFNADTTPATYSMTLKVFCRDDDYECKRENAAGGGSKSTGSSGNTKNSKGGKYDDHDDDDDNGKSTKSSRDDKGKYDKRYGNNRKLHSENDYHYKDDEEEGPVLIASVTVHYLIGGGEGTDTDGDGICDSQDIWGDCPDPEEECKYHEYLEINGCKTLACKDSCLIPDWVYNCEKYEHDCDDYLICVETGANAAAENGFITREQSGSVKECAYQADVCADSDKSKSKTSKDGQYYSNKKEGNRRRRRKSTKRGRRLNEPDAFEFESPTNKLMPDSLLIKASGTGGKRTARRQRKTPGGVLP